jgi:hypothetical protein
MSTVHNKKVFRTDLKYARQVMQEIEKAILSNGWEDVEGAANELSGMFASMTQLAEDNKEGIDCFNHKYDYEIEEIRKSTKETAQ